MGAMKDVYTAAIDRLHVLIAQLEEEGHVLAADLRKELDKLRGEAPVIEAEVKADTGQLVTEAENDAAQAVEHVVDAVEQPATPAATAEATQG